MNEPLTPLNAPLEAYDANALRDLLKHMRKNYRLQYSNVARKIGIPEDEMLEFTGYRSNGTNFILKKVLSFCDENKIIWKSFFKKIDYSLDTLRLESGISEDILESSSKSHYGAYILYTMASESKITATYYRLLAHSSKSSMPRFIAWRTNHNNVSSFFHGVYYNKDDSLYLIGGIKGSALPRFITLIPVPRTISKQDKHGVICGSSHIDTLFAAPCYFQRLSADAKRSNYINAVGEYAFSDAEAAFPDICRFLIKKKNLPMSFERPSGA